MADSNDHPIDIPPGAEDDFVEEYVLGEHTDESPEVRANQLEDLYADNPRVLAAVMRFRLDCLISDSDALPALYRAIARWPHVPEIRAMLINRLVAQKRFAEAEVLLQPLIDAKCVDQIDMIYDLALARFQAGQHRDGLRLLEACQTISPEIERNPSFAKLRQITTALTTLKVSFDARKRFRQDRALRGFFHFMAGVGVLLILALVGLGIGSVYLGRHAEVYVVNGLDRDYTVTLNGSPYRMQSHGVRKLDLPEGDIRLAVPDLPAISTAIEAVHQSFFTRPFWPAIFVINPDRGAIFEQSFRKEDEFGSTGPPQHQRYIAGKTVLVFTSIDLPFEPFPTSASGSRGAVRKTRLSLVQHRYDFSVQRDIPAIAAEMPSADLLELLDQQVRLSKDSTYWQNVLDEARGRPNSVR